ncbi:glycosyltransferase family 4 protein [Aureimonas sp. AU12]|uniref:glycosyltransferase family 4 protein n=1 Tax=Aureimonas sp. AU12 TaxID=1638161 RepID=UPI0007849F74|nr:glycosyltransferase family 4 protein [Aureimonas sp. AU12]
MDDRHRLLIVGPRSVSGHEGGVEKFAEEFVNHAAGVADISVMVLTGDETRRDVRILKVPASKLMRTDKALYLVHAFWRILTGRYDRVFILGINFAMLAPLARLMGPRGTRVVVRSGSIDHILAKWGPVMSTVFQVSEKLARFAHRVVAVTPSIQKHLATLGIEASVIRNGLARAQREAPVALAERSRSVLAVGRLTVQKNYRVLVEAAALLGDDCPDIAIVGGADNSPEAPMLAALATERGASRVSFMGARPREEVLKEMRRHGLFINCSHHEGMSNAVLEAIQEGMPLILSDIDANRDLAFPDRFYFDPDAPQGLADKIREAMLDPQAFVVSRELFDDWQTTIGHFCDVLDIPRPAAGQQPAVAAVPVSLGDGIRASA